MGKGLGRCVGPEVAKEVGFDDEPGDGGGVTPGFEVVAGDPWAVDPGCADGVDDPLGSVEDGSVDPGGIDRVGMAPGPSIASVAPATDCGSVALGVADGVPDFGASPTAMIAATATSTRAARATRVRDAGI